MLERIYILCELTWRWEELLSWNHEVDVFEKSFFLTFLFRFGTGTSFVIIRTIKIPFVIEERYNQIYHKISSYLYNLPCLISFNSGDLLQSNSPIFRALYFRILLTSGWSEAWCWTRTRERTPLRILNAHVP